MSGAVCELDGFCEILFSFFHDLLSELSWVVTCICLVLTPMVPCLLEICMCSCGAVCAHLDRRLVTILVSTFLQPPPAGYVQLHVCLSCHIFL